MMQCVVLDALDINVPSTIDSESTGFSIERSNQSSVTLTISAPYTL